MKRTKKRRRPTRSEALRRRAEAREDAKGRVRASNEKVEKIASHRETVVLTREDHPEAWEYVEEAFPRLAQRIRETTVYRNENTYFCKKIGIPPSAGGLFIIKASAILVCYNRKLEDDVVIVHEMLHYASQLMGSRFRHEDEEEDFAYLRSIPYLARRYGRDWIAGTYLLPYYWSRERRDEEKARNRRLTPKEDSECRARALDKCKSLVDKTLGEGESPEDGEEEGEGNRFSLL